MNSYCDDSALIPSKCSTHDCGNGVAIEYPFWYMDVNSSDEVSSAIGCLEFSTNQSYVSMTENQINDVYWIGNCEEKVVATVMRTEITTNGLISEFGGAMNKGFMLDWRTVKGCGSCEDSGGFCGVQQDGRRV
ncbi:hypothetical protein GH714_033239 [Hevea brasiliensis]|uniref:Wall-associated receptor kinase C-terminal domain-containing protein n=1 Tax=Hevea brasiliensis TaxID=3981 RepID=A0A6A6L696_HEVBR|nr:hypothetical protein GH714_033239 [Hevea brasiliensis]